MTTAAELFYASINSEADLSRLKNDATPETLHLEFKRKGNSRNGVPDDEDKKKFSKTLSAFANSDGGVLLWGIGTQKQKGRDVACRLEPITDVTEFRSRLGQYLKDAAQPYVDGVLLDILDSTSTSGAGYLKCLVPASTKTPHRAMGDREYYKRSAEGCYRLEHFDLEDMFGRRQRPYLELFVDLGSSVDGYEQFTFSMENQGRALAHHVGLIASSEQIDVVHAGGGFIQFPDPSPGLTTFGWTAELTMIHPIPLRMVFGKPVLLKRRAPGPITLKATWYCEHMSYRERVFTFN